jgi:hypothetical protein
MRLAMLAAMAGIVLAEPASALDKVKFGTNWLADPEAGGFYQALADGTYEKYGRLGLGWLPGDIFIQGEGFTFYAPIQPFRHLHDCSGLLPAGAFGRVGLAPTGKRRLVTAHTSSGHSRPRRWTS